MKNPKFQVTIIAIIVVIVIAAYWGEITSFSSSDEKQTTVETIAPAKIVPTATLTPIPAVYSGCSGLEDLIPKLALPGSVTLSYWQVVNLGIDSACDNIIKKVNKPENLKN